MPTETAVLEFTDDVCQELQLFCRVLPKGTITSHFLLLLLFYLDQKLMASAVDTGEDKSPSKQITLILILLL